MGKLHFMLLQIRRLFRPIMLLWRSPCKMMIALILSLKFPETLYRTNYKTKESDSRTVEASEFNRNYKFGEHITLPFFSGYILEMKVIMIRIERSISIFSNFNSAVGTYRGMGISGGNGSSVLTLSQSGLNKARIVDYLNGSVKVLSENMLKRKNLFATKTIRFIDSSLAVQAAELKMVEDELNDFRNENSVLDISAESGELSGKLSKLDVQKEEIRRQLAITITWRNICKPEVIILRFLHLPLLVFQKEVLPMVFPGSYS